MGIGRKYLWHHDSLWFCHSQTQASLTYLCPGQWARWRVRQNQNCFYLSSAKLAFRSNRPRLSCQMWALGLSYFRPFHLLDSVQPGKVEFAFQYFTCYMVQKKVCPFCWQTNCSLVPSQYTISPIWFMQPDNVKVDDWAENCASKLPTTRPTVDLCQADCIPLPVVYKTSRN